MQNSKDLKWYRARVTGEEQLIDGQMIYDVFYIDLGMREFEIDIDRIRKINEQINSTPGMVQQCSLDEIVPREGTDWSEDALRIFRDIVDGFVFIYF